uniref:Programmed cell death 8/apoptosis inducing factor n=1 Tax=Suberites domuncula TaxID=55567 RepID=A7M869_SUBDO|nr:programmed cell death 8/apoptosis inducing factor [Suberites domuncula]
MAANLWRSSFQAALRSSRSVRTGSLHGRRAASTASQGGGNLNLIIAAGVGVAGVTSFAMWRANRNQSKAVGIHSMNQEKVAGYQKTGATHPEAEAEKLISPPTVPDTPPATPIVSTEVMGEVPVKPTDVASLELPKHVQYVLIGAGTASFAAAKAIREKDPKAKVLIIGEEEYTPYSRPPLSKQLWLYEDHEATKELKFKASWSGGKLVDPFYKWNFCDPKELPDKEEGGVAVLTGTKAVGLNPGSKTIKLDNGLEVSYEKCLLATGGRPRNLPVFADGPSELKERVSVYRAIPDYLSLDKLASSVESILVVGGGFLGSELAVGLASRGKERGLSVTQMFPEGGNLGLVLPNNLCQWTTDKVRKEGVKVHPGTLISKATVEEGKVKVTLTNGDELQADHVVVAVGLQPNTQLATSAKLETDPEFGGFRVNAELQACSDVWVAGDSSCFFDPHLGRRRVEHHDHANVSGRLAGENMTGEHKRFTHQSMFWSDVGPEVGFEATGLVNSKLPTVGIWARKTSEESELPVDDFSKGVVFYLNSSSGRIVGVLTWNAFGKMDLAKQIIADEKTDGDIGDLAAKFDIHPKDSQPSS